MRYVTWFRQPRTKNEMWQFYTAFDDELGVRIKVRVRRSPKYLPTAWDDLERGEFGVRCWKIYGRTQWK
ncbi:hypothetical protein [Arenicella xantha]|uniref:Uncharacterized protein n=1 Tax=Arenicella xantha TaxID=644221 RepID=A0A395JMF6_9GAMM|nr:hypothetical protein [Arenicella xantha]RBP51027.1 hypothetical protein DFR28_102446 [Arenicella xantha]